jgi:predicted dehydrogenase
MAVVGVGALGRHHARILSELDSAELVAVAEPNAAVGQAVAEKHGSRWVSDYQQLILQDCIDAVAVVVPTSAHLKVASDFLRRGIPVLVEKPLAATVEQAETLVELSEQHRTPLQVGHVERFNPAYEATKKLCGSPKYIRAERLSPYAFRSTDIGVVHDLMIHDLDLVLDLVGAPIVSAEAFGVCVVGGHEDSVQARLRFENGCIADLTANRVNPTPRRAMQVWSSKGVVNVDFTSREVVAHCPSETLLYGSTPLERSRQPGADIEQLKREIFGTYI